MSKTIDFQVLASIIRYLDEIFCEEDGENDGRKIRAYERAIENRLKKLNADKQMEDDIRKTHCILDRTYEAQCNRLRAKGYTIINNQKKETKNDH